MNLKLRLLARLVGAFLAAAPAGNLFGQAATSLGTDVINMAKHPPTEPAPVVASSPETDEAREIARLEGLPTVKIPIQATTLAGAINIIAGNAGMNLIAPDQTDFTDEVALTTMSNPWKLLQLLSERYRFSMRYQSGVWLFSRESAGALIAKTYVLKHTNLDTMQSSGGQSGMNDTASTSDSSRTSGQGFNMVYKVESKQVIDDIRQLIGLPPLASQTVIVKNGDARLPIDDGRASAGTPKKEESVQRVIYLRDTNALYVVAFRSQHEHIAEYIRQLDQAPVQIRIEARFFATSNDPSKIIGLDPSEFQPKVSLDNLTTGVDLNHVRATRMPNSAVLSSSALSLQLNALEKDSKTEQVQNPWIVTTNNHEALFSVGSEEPFLDSSTMSPGAVDGGLGSTTNRISVKRVGTAVNVVPTLFVGEPGQKPKIRLTVKLEIGRITGYRQVTSQVNYPIVDSQKYEYTVYIEEGQSLAFGGLSGLSTSKNESRVPVLSRIPVLGRIFKSTNTQDSQRKLIGYIIPTIVHEQQEEAPPVQLSTKSSEEVKTSSAKTSSAPRLAGRHINQ